MKNYLIFFLVISLLSCVKKHKYQIDYHKNGKVRLKYEVKNGVPNGYMFEYYKSGKLKSKSKFVNGKKNGEFEQFTPSGVSIVRGFYKEDLLDGTLLEFYNSGEIKAKRNYRSGNEFGIQKEFYENGKIRLMLKVIIFNNKKHFMEEVEYDKTGEIVFNSKDFFQYEIPDKIHLSSDDYLKITIRQSKLKNHIVFYGNNQAYNENFELINDQYLDTIQSKKPFIKVPLNSNKLGNNTIKGILMDIDTLEIIGDSLVVADHFDRYFEFMYEVVK